MDVVFVIDKSLSMFEQHSSPSNIACRSRDEFESFVQSTMIDSIEKTFGRDAIYPTAVRIAIVAFDKKYHLISSFASTTREYLEGQFYDDMHAFAGSFEAPTIIATGLRGVRKAVLRADKGFRQFQVPVAVVMLSDGHTYEIEVL